MACAMALRSATLRLGSADCSAVATDPTLAILDWMMPEMDGPDVCRRVRQELPLANMYLLLVTAREIAGKVVPLVPHQHAGCGLRDDLLAVVRRDHHHIGSGGQARGHLPRGHWSPPTTTTRRPARDRCSGRTSVGTA